MTSNDRKWDWVIVVDRSETSCDQVQTKVGLQEIAATWKGEREMEQTVLPSFCCRRAHNSHQICNSACQRSRDIQQYCKYSMQCHLSSLQNEKITTLLYLFYFSHYTLTKMCTPLYNMHIIYNLCKHMAHDDLYSYNSFAIPSQEPGKWIAHFYRQSYRVDQIQKCGTK